MEMPTPKPPSTIRPIDVRRATLVLNPVTDAEFVRAATVLGQDARTPKVLESRLRAIHPRAVVRARDLDGDAFPIWYVYRDGGWRSE
jgi:hypothetical protein